jgi:two-component system response regulator
MNILMLIEDNEDDILLTKRVIRKLCPSCNLAVATDGEMGVKCLFEKTCTPADLILLDINLPKINGLDILRMIKADPALAATPVVILTSSSYEADKTKAAQYGADMFVTKPLSMKEFELKVKEILERYIR